MKHVLRPLALLAAASAALLPAVAVADIYTFTFTRPGFTETFSLESTSFWRDSAPPYFVSYNTPGLTYSSNGYSRFVTFRSPPLYADFDWEGPRSLDYAFANGSVSYYLGDIRGQMFEWWETDAVFLPGTYPLTDMNTGAPAQMSIVRGALAPAAPAPEVGTGLGAMLAAAVALLLTRRRRAVA